jgi:hypothetical protein
MVSEKTGHAELKSILEAALGLENDFGNTHARMLVPKFILKFSLRF